MESLANTIEHQRRLLKQLQQLIQNFDRKPKDEKTRGLSKSYVEEIDTLSKEFKENHDALCLYVDDNALQQDNIPYLKDDVFYAFKDLYLTFKGKILELSMDLQSVNSPSPHTSTFNVPSNFHNESVYTDARLPKIQLPSFSGDYLSWIYYRDMFQSLVHSNQSLSNVQKYYFLKGSCQGTPQDIVNEYPASDASYELAWAALNMRYHNKKMIVEALLGKLFSIPNANGSFQSIQTLLDTTRKCLALLRTMQINVDSWDAILVFLTINKLDTQSRKEWEQSLKASTEVPSMKDLLTFLETTFRTLESVDNLNSTNIEPLVSSEKTKKTMLNNRRPFFRNVHLTGVNDMFNCPCCEKRHLLYKCFKFAALPSAARRDLLTSKSICRNCLNSGHSHADCRLSSRCHICQEPHHTIVHNDFSENSYNYRPSTSSGAQRTDLTSQHTASVNQMTSSNDQFNNFACNCSALDTVALPQVLLATIRIPVQVNGKTFFLRALLDQAAQGTFITEDAVQTLQLQKFNTFAKISGIGGNVPIIARNFVTLCLHSLYESNFNLKCNAIVLPSITSYQPLAINKTILSGFENIFLADPYFAERSQIDLLIGGDVYGEIVLPEHKRQKNSIFLQLTHFGWVVSGPTSKISYDKNINVNVCALDDLLRAFWEQEELIEKRHLTIEDTACEKHFEMTHMREKNGRYTVSLPFKSVLNGFPLPTFSHTDYSALRRLKQLEAKFKGNLLFAEEYRKFMDEYEKLGHMRRVGIYPKDLQPNSYFLPHHGVLRESSTTTKLRVVFDGSSKTPHCSSLNEELSPGPALQNDLPTIITRWRRFKVGFRSDLEKMFRQIKILPEQQNYQQILWRDPTTDNILIYKLCTVTYGTTSAPYLSIKVLQQLAEDEKESFPNACGVLLSDTYVDDVISGADTVSEAESLQIQLCELLKSGGFNLRKWISNSSELLNTIPEEYKEITNKFQFDNTVVKALGLEWDTTSDVFQFKIHFDECLHVTKRKLLSDAAKLYDPLGWLAPTTILAKITFQKLWLAGLDWNDPLPDDLKTEWINYRNSLKQLEGIQIPRWIGCNKTSGLEIHGFCDASQVAYAAVVYIKVTDSIGEGIVTLLQSKTKVAPLKTVSIPRLELCGASLLVKLVQKLRSQLGRDIYQTFFWTDSSTVLSWIRGQPSKWSVYVGNRVADIQRLSDISQWRHVSTLFNPADCASRGVPPQELKHHSLWWGGPSWLSKSPDSWPKQPSFTNSMDLELRRKEMSVNVSSCVEYPSILSKYSSLNKLIRITTALLRFKHNSLSKLYKTEKKFGFFKTSELQHALKQLIKLGQSFEFEAELTLLRNGKLGKSKNRIVNLCPFIDHDGILRVGGRLQNSNLNFSLKHPILLTKRNPLSALIFRNAHILTLHGGLQLIQSFVAQKYWIISGRNLAKRIQRECITCFKYNATAAHQIMGNLPPVRLQPTRPFKHSGVDYAGPITIKQSTARNTIMSKGYICLFICMVTKAIHLEAVTTLSTESFLAAFKRFVSRRGMCTDLYSDCGTNFVGANKELQILNNRSKSTLPDELVEILANTGTTWHFIPPASPNFGGLWEAGVKSTKHHLHRIMENRILTYEELSTLLSQIESCLNSRPLCPLSTDPLDCNALTPSHFLIGEPTLCIPEEDLLECNIDRLSRWKIVERLKQQFWRRWANECLNRLQARPKWLRIHRNAQVGDLVLIVDERCPPGQWPLGRVQQVHPGYDGYVRVVTLLSNGKQLKRPISKVAFLPINQGYSTEEEDTEDIPSSTDNQLAVSASDPDCGVNAMVNYTLGEGIKQLAEFEVRPASGEICIASDLDYEKRSSYEFPVIATDRGGLSTSAMVKIQLIDVNDNRPEFYPKEYNVSLRDTSTGLMSDDETPVVSVVATDPDSGRNGEVTYRIVAGNNDGIFRIDKMTGEVFVDRPNLLSMSIRSHPFHILNISATDGGGIKTSQDAVIYISIIDSTQRPPIFEKSRYNYYVKEDVARGTVVGSVMALSSDSGSRNVVSYSIYTGDPDDYFSIDKNSGNIRVAKPLDHEAKPQVLLNIQAKSGDPPAYGHTQVNIDIEDVNDNPPEFETSMVRISVPENVELGTPLYAAHARDKDSGKSGIVTYSLTMIGSIPSHLNVTTAAAAGAMYGGSSMFMSPGLASGSSSSASSLTSSSSSSLISSLHGGNGGMGRLYSIRNGNHNQIGSGSQQQLYGMGAGGSSASSYLLANSLPLDLQQQQHHLVRPSATNQAQLFAIDSRSGHLTLSRHLDYETSQRHSLIVTATDSGEPPLSANLTILVEVQDVNDNPPVFERNEYSIKVLESMPINSQILQVTAIDLDTGNNARLTYRLTDASGNDKKFQPKANLTIPLNTNGAGLRSLAMMAIKGVTNAPITASSDPNQLFGIFPNSGWIYLRGTLDRETRDRYELTVMASDNGTPSAHAKTRVTVNILDANDNDPRFLRNTYEFAIEENMRRGAIVGTVAATDLDLDANAAIRYSLIPSNTSFQVNPVTGEIITREPLDRETRSLYDLVAEARDQGTPYRSARVAVKVMVTDVNDNSPDIVDPQEDVVSVREEQPPGTEVVRIRAVDRDNGQNASITYTILKGRDSDGYGLFSIDPSSGQIRTRVVLDHEERSIYRLAVAATDSGAPPKQTVRLLRVEVLDLNDNRPTFTSSSLVFRVREDVPVGHVVGSVGPSERSDTQNMIAEPGLHITYTLTSLTKDIIEGAFDMDRQTGFLVVARRLDREQQSEYRLEIRALDNTASNNPQSSAITVKVEIADVNDNPPKWAEDPIMIYVSESTAIGVIIYNFTATDADTGTNGELQYQLLRQSPDGVDTTNQQQDQQQNQNQEQQKQSLFSVDPLTGALTLQAALDYETISEYILIVQALDQSSNASERLHSTVTARILVEDANDNGPVFVSPAGGSDTIIELSDATQVGQLVAHVVATDKDAGDNGHITYAILSGNEDGRFRIDSKTGFIELAKSLPQMMGNDDANGIYGNRLIQVNSRSSSSSNGGHKANNKFNLVISASDHGSPQSKQSHLNLQILVQGTTSNPPRFLRDVYEVNIAENLPSGSTVLSVGAKSFNGANLTYKIPLGVANNHFIVDTYRGFVTSQGQFDRETKDEYTIPIYVFETNRAPSVAIQRAATSQATSAAAAAAQSTHVTSAESQHQHGQQFDIATIVIKITDVNDHAPEFHPGSYRMSVPENSDLAVIHTVVATDLDEGANGEIVYSIIGGNLGNKFSIDMHTGELTARSLDREQHSRYLLQIQAQDRGTPITYQGLCNITVSVSDQNDNDPRFEQSKYIANIPEDIAIGSSVLKVRANDADFDTRIVYSLSNETQWLFAIDNQTGLITVVGPLDRERQHIYNFEVVATDDGPYDSRSQRVPVQIIVEDVNDNKPIFERYPFRTQVPTLNQPGKALLKVSATDADQGINGEIFYSLIKDATANKFRIDPNTGTVSATQSLASENGKLLHLEVMAQDKGNPRQSSVGLIEIRVGEVQADSPLLRFHNDTYHVRLRENTAIGQSVIRVNAVRSDGRRQKIIYSFGAGNEDDAFSIDAITGEIKVRNSEHLDYEKYSWSSEAQSSSMASSNGRSLFHNDDIGAGNRSNSLSMASNRTPTTTQTVRRMRRGITYNSNNDDVAATAAAVADHSSPVPSEMRLILVAHTEETPLLYGYAELHIILEDENDNGPHFTQQQYSATVWEGNSKGTLVVQVQAMDADAGSNSRVLYHIVDGNHDNAFVIEPAFSGIVKTNIVLDREIRDIYKLKVIATDEGVPQMTGTATIQVHIIDVNDNQPTFPPHSVISVSEGTEPGSVITIISANDVDTYPELTYRFATEDDTTSNSNSNRHTSTSAQTKTKATIYEENTAIFAIDRYSGKVILRKRLDFELQEEYQLEIIASDTAHEARTTLTVRVTDENDNAPVFKQPAYYTMLPDQMSSNGDIELLTVNATDIDSELNALIRYSIHPPQAGFSIHESSGTVYVNTSRINAAVGRDDIYLTILATDSGTPPQQSSTIVMVQSNANSQGRAQFLQTQYRTSINEEAPLGTVVLRLSQDVLDTELTQHLVFTIVTGNEDGTFEVYQSSAIILVQALDRERVDLYKLRLIMSEKGAPLRADNNSSAINVFVTVEDANDNSPVFDSSGQYEAEISESAPLRYSIAQLFAVDADLENTPNSDIVYDITSGNDEGMFTVDLVSGVLFVNNQLDYDRGAMNYELIVRACDSAAVPRCSLQPFGISLVDENDNAPRFPVAEYIEFIGENEAVGTSIFTARATDLDRGIYGNLNYSIDQSDPHSMVGDELIYKLFRVDATSGVVTSNAIFDYEQRNRYDFVLRATDTGGKYVTVKVRIMIDSRDEYSPQFTERTYRFVMSSPAEENMQLGYTVGQVSASDRDKGADGRVVYQLTSQHAYFKVNRTTGAVVIKKKLDDNFDDGRDISLVITASSGRQGSLTNMTVVEISLDPLGSSNTNVASNIGAPSSGSGFADWALGLLIAFLLVICAFAGIFLFLHMRNRRHRQVSKPSLSTETVGNTNSYVDPSAFDTIPIRGGSGATGSAGQFAPPKYDEIPPYGPHAASSNSGAATTSELSGSEQSGSSGRGSAEDDGEDEEIRMINEGPLHRDHHRGSDDGRLSDISVQNTQEYLARLGIVDNPNTTGAASTSSRRCSESIGGSNKDSHLHHPLPIDSLHMFDEEPGGESDITNLIYAKLNDVNGGSDRASSTDEAATTAGSIGAAVDHVMGFGDVPVVGSGNVGPSMNGSLSSIVHSEEELTGSYNWDYLLDWGPQYQPLAHVFSEIARLKDDTLSVHSGNSGASSSAKSKQSLAHSAKHIPPPLLTNVAPRSINVPVLSSRGSGSHHSSVPANQYLLPRSPISHDAPGGGFSTSSAMSPSFSPSLSPLATRSPSISPHVVGGVPTGHHMVSLPRHQPQPQQRKNLDNEMRVRM